MFNEANCLIKHTCSWRVNLLHYFLRKSAYRGVINVGFSENFVHVLNEWLLYEDRYRLQCSESPIIFLLSLIITSLVKSFFYTSSREKSRTVFKTQSNIYGGAFWQKLLTAFNLWLILRKNSITDVPLKSRQKKYISFIKPVYKKNCCFYGVAFLK